MFRLPRQTKPAPRPMSASENWSTCLDGRNGREVDLIRMLVGVPLLAQGSP
jgi:hypothetical protein